MEKAICEMNREELATEYLFCVEASECDYLDPETRKHFANRAVVIKKYIEEM